MLVRGFVVLFFCLSASGCPSREVGALPPDPSSAVDRELNVVPNPNLDILWVIDNSGSMEAEQNSLAANFPRFIEELERLPIGLPNLHMAVISTDMGFGGADCGNNDNGAFYVHGGSTIQGGQRFLSDVADSDGPEGSRIRNYSSGDLASEFSGMATSVGIAGCGLEQPLEAMKAALSSTDNPGFLRDDAFLAVIFITDEDDCSVSTGEANQWLSEGLLDSPWPSFRCFQDGVICSPDEPAVPGTKNECRPRSGELYDIQEYVDFLHTIKGNPERLIVAGLMGETTDEFGESLVVVENATNPRNNRTGPHLKRLCETGGDTTSGADPAVRLERFLNQFPQQSVLQSICPSDLSPALRAVGEMIVRNIGQPCLPTLLDTDPSAPGTQAECAVEYIAPGAGTVPVSVPPCIEIPVDPSMCPEVSEPCWYLWRDPSCMSESNEKINICYPPEVVDGASNVQCLV